MGVSNRQHLIDPKIPCLTFVVGTIRRNQTEDASGCFCMRGYDGRNPTCILTDLTVGLHYPIGHLSVQDVAFKNKWEVRSFAAVCG